MIEHSRDCEMWIGVFRPRLVREAMGSPLTRRNPPDNWVRTLAREDADELSGALRAVARTGNDAALGNAGLGYLLRLADRVFASAAEEPDLTPELRWRSGSAELIEVELDPIFRALVAALAMIESNLPPGWRG